MYCKSTRPPCKYRRCSARRGGFPCRHSSRIPRTNAGFPHIRDDDDFPMYLFISASPLFRHRCGDSFKCLCPVFALSVVNIPLCCSPCLPLYEPDGHHVAIGVTMFVGASGGRFSTISTCVSCTDARIDTAELSACNQALQTRGSESDFYRYSRNIGKPKAHEKSLA